jgi:hypothetical protein
MARSKALTLLLMGILALNAVPSLAQTARLEVRSNAPDAVVFVDGNWVGRKADGPFEIPVQSREVRVTVWDDALWSVDPLLFDIAPVADSTLVLHAHFPRVYQFDSTPSGADVRVGDRVLGQTPLRVEQREAIDSVYVALAGYGEISRPLGTGLWNREVFDLMPQGPGNATATGFVVEGKRRDWISIAATTSALAAGALAIHFRTKADNRFEDYHRDGKISLKSDIRRLDVQSGVALGAMQLGLGVVVIRLAF